MHRDEATSVENSSRITSLKEKDRLSHDEGQQANKKQHLHLHTSKQSHRFEQKELTLNTVSTKKSTLTHTLAGQILHRFGQKEREQTNWTQLKQRFHKKSYLHERVLTALDHQLHHAQHSLNAMASPFTSSAPKDTCAFKIHLHLHGQIFIYKPAYQVPIASPEVEGRLSHDEDQHKGGHPHSYIHTSWPKSASATWPQLLKC